MTQPKPGPVFYDFDSFRIDPSRRLLLQDGEPIPLTSKVFDTLLALVEGRGEILTKERLLEEVWPDTFVSEGSLAQNVSVLRKALGERAGEHRYIVTVPRHGYRFVAPLREARQEEPTEAGGEALSVRPPGEVRREPVETRPIRLPREEPRGEARWKSRGKSRRLRPAVLLPLGILGALAVGLLGTLAWVGISRLGGPAPESSPGWGAGEAFSAEARSAGIDPGSPLVHSAMARAWADQGYDAQAVAAAEEAFRRSEGLPRRQRLWIEAQLRETRGEWERAGALYRSLLTFYPDDFEAGLRLSTALRSAGRAEEALELLGKLEAAPGPAAGESRLHLERALAFKGLARPREGVEAARKARRLARQAGEAAVVGMALVEEGVFLSGLGRLDEALDLYGEAVEVLSPLGNPSIVAVALNTAAVAHSRRGEMDEARRLYEQALETFRRTGHRRGIASQLTNLGMLEKSEGRLSEALRHFREADRLFEEVGDRHGRSVSLSGLGSTLRQQGDLEGARQAQQLSLELSLETGHPGDQLAALNNLAVLDLDAGHLVPGLGRLQRMLEILGEDSRTLEAAAAKANSGQVHLELGQLAPARRLHEEASGILEELGLEEERLEVVSGLARLDLLEGRLAEAEERIAQGLRQGESLGLRRLTAQLSQLQGRLLRERGQPAAARRVLEGVLESLEGEGGGAVEVALRLELAGAHLQEGAAARAEELAEESLGQASNELVLEAALLLAEAHLAQGRSEPAETALARARELARRTESRLAALRLALREAALAAARGASASAAVDLESVVQEAERAGFEVLKLEARLALGHLRLRLGEEAAGQRLLTSVQQEADALGLARLAAAVEVPVEVPGSLLGAPKAPSEAPEGRPAIDG